jgi:hypothetical protein
MTQTLTFLLPVIALILALILCAVLWYWWSSGQPDTPPEGADQPGQAQGSASSLQGRLMSVWAGLRGRARGLASSAGTAIEARRMGLSGSALDGDMVEVLRLYRDLSNGALVVEIGRQRFYALDEIGDDQVRRRFLGNAEAMAQFARLKKGTSPLIDWSTEAPDVAPPEPPATASVAASSKTRPAAEGQTGKKGKEAPPPKSMADEIEELLQYQLTVEPDLGSRSIHIRSADDGSIFVEVDGVTFDGVSGVSDLEVRSFLQKIIRDWEESK